MQLKAMRDEVLVKKVLKEKTESGLYIPEKSQKCMKGEVVSVGTKRLKGEKELPFEVDIGDTVIFPKGTGQEVETGDDDDNETLILIKHEDLLAKIVG